MPKTTELVKSRCYKNGPQATFPRLLALCWALIRCLDGICFYDEIGSQICLFMPSEYICQESSTSVKEEAL